MLRYSLPMDTIEAIVWGQFCDWGTNKHPPLSGFLAYGFWLLGGGSAYALYALSQICVLIGFVYIYKLAEMLLDKPKAMLATMLLEGVIYYGFSAAEFNVNVVSLALWPMTAYYFYKALKEDRLSDWVFTGVFAGLNLLNKYVSGVLLLSMALMMIFDKTSRQKLKTFKPYVTALVCLAIFVPHVYWLWQHDFFVIDYFLGRGSRAEFDNLPILRHIVYPVKFVAAQILFGLGTLLIYFLSTRKAKAAKRNETGFDRNFVFYLGVLPFLIMVVISAASGIKLKSMWGYPALYMLGIVLMSYFPYQMTEALKKKMIAGVYIVMGLLAVGQMCILLFNKSDKMHLNAEHYGQIIENLWAEQNQGKPFKYVAGDVWWADNVALFAPSEPKPVIWGDISKNPWFDAKDFEQSGGILVTAGQGEYEAAAEKLKNVTEPQTLELEFKNRLGKKKRKTIYFGFF